jgi:hypothetical protein
LARVELKHLPKETSQDAIEFLRSKYQKSASVHGSTVDIKDVTDKQLRLIIRKFLHSRSMDAYRAVSEPGQVEILPPKPEHEHVKIDKRVSAQAAATMPYYFPDTPVLKPIGKKKN